MADGIGMTVVTWSADLAVAAYGLALAASCYRGCSHAEGLARGAWTAGLVAELSHLLAAFHFVHHWSQASAYAEIVRRTTLYTGWEWGGGLYVNYGFTLLWLADTLWWWLAPQSRRQRPFWLGLLIQGFLAFIMFNAAVVFADGPVRYLSLLALVGLAVLAYHTRGYRDGTKSCEPEVVNLATAVRE